MEKGPDGAGGLIRQGRKRYGETINGVVPARNEASKGQRSPRGETPHGFPGIIYWKTSQEAKPNPVEPAKKAPKAVRSGAWTPSEISALLGTLGGDLIKETIVERSRHSIEACYAKIKRLGHTVHELRSVAFTVEELAEMLRVTTRRIRTWKEKGWLTTTRRRITGKDLVAFFKEHHELVTFAALPLEVRTFLMDLGYPAKEASRFKANVKSIMDTVAGRKKRCDAQTSDRSDSGEERPSKRILDKIDRWKQLRKQQRIGPQHSRWYPWPSSLDFAAQAAV